MAVKTEKAHDYQGPELGPLSPLIRIGAALVWLGSLTVMFAVLGVHLQLWGLVIGFELLGYGVALTLISIPVLLWGLTLDYIHHRSLAPALLALLMAITVAAIPLWWIYNLRYAPPLQPINIEQQERPRVLAMPSAKDPRDRHG